MLLTHGPFVCLSCLLTLFAPFTWASLPRRQPIPISPGAAYSLPPEGSPTLAPGWSPSPPVWSPPTAAASTSAPGWSYGYPPQPTTTPYVSDTSGVIIPTSSAPMSACTPFGCNVFYQVSNSYLNTYTCVFITFSGLLWYTGLKPLRTLLASLKQQDCLWQRSHPEWPSMILPFYMFLISY